jgi:methionyl-tRNA formyltransferase
MKIIFFGTPEPAAVILEKLIADGHQIVLAVTQPDRQKGRGLKVAFSPVKEIALKNNLPVEQPEKVKQNPIFRSLLESLKADIAIVVAYGKILPADLLNIPQNGFINVHASLLPKYRGAAPIQWALLNGEKETGVTIMKVIEQLDAGAVIAQERVAIEEKDDAIALSKKIFAAGGELLTRTLKEIEQGKAQPIAQDEKQVCFAPSLTKESGEIDWRKTAAEINNRVRALVPWPVAHTFYQGKMLKIWQAEPQTIDLQKKELAPGQIAAVNKAEGLVVATGQGNLMIGSVQPAGGRQMPAYDYVIGHDVEIGETLPN